MSPASRRPAAASLAASPAAASKARSAGPASARTAPAGAAAASANAKSTHASTLDVFAGDPNFMTSLARGLLVIQAFSPQTPQMTHLAACGEDRHLSRRRSALPVYIGQAGICRRGGGIALRAAPAHAGAVEQLLGLQLAVHRGAAHSGTHVGRAARELFGGHAGRRRDCLHCALHRVARDERRPAHRQPPACLLHQHRARVCWPICPRNSWSSIWRAWC